MFDKKEAARSWLAVELEVKAEQEELAGWLLMQCGAKGCQIMPKGTDEVVVSATFERADMPESGLEKLRSSLEMYGLAYALKTLRTRVVPEEDWLAEWKKGFKPFPIGDMFLVTPPWFLEKLSPEQTAARHVIVVEPGMAFGTGLHETTRYCLRALAQNPEVENIADIGTGSGILAIAAALMKPHAHIVAVDTDPAAIRVAAENCELNGVSERVQLLECSTELLDDQAFDCLLSNLTCEDIIALLLDYLRILQPDGIIICAGILREKLPKLEAAIETYPLSIIDRDITEMWAGLTIKRVGVSLRPS
jgi:ribosomal protein L11 methyltransferase